MAWYYAIAERDHDIQNPTSREKIRLMGEWLRLGPETRVLDIASGKGGPALVLASIFGCRITGVERYPGFAATARERSASSRQPSSHASRPRPTAAPRRTTSKRSTSTPSWAAAGG